MSKTLKQFLEVYRPKSPDEQKFVDKHVTIKHKDRNGNGDDVFTASNVKTVKRKEEGHGYDSGEDEKVYEELKGNQHKIDANKNGKVDAHDFKLLRKKKKVAEEAEELDELSHSTLRSYRMKAKSIADHGDDPFYREKGRALASRKSYGGRMAGIEKAKVMASEEAEDLDESAKIAAHLIKRYGDNVRKSHVMSAAKDFGVDSSKLAKAVRKKLGVNSLAEEEQIDELSKDTVKKYKKAAVKDFYDADAVDDGPRVGQRYRGIKMANRKLAKEEVEELDELSKDKMLKYLSANKKDDTKARETGDFDKMTKRMRGTDLAVRKYTAKPGSKYVRVPATEEVEDVTEVAPSGAKYERMVKHIKKGYAKGGLSDRERAIAYATAWKAKKANEGIEYTAPTLEDILECNISDLAESHKTLMTDVFSKLSEENQVKFVEACETPEGLNMMLDFAIENRGE